MCVHRIILDLQYRLLVCPCFPLLPVLLLAKGPWSWNVPRGGDGGSSRFFPQVQGGDGGGGMPSWSKSWAGGGGGAAFAGPCPFRCGRWEVAGGVENDRAAGRKMRMNVRMEG